ncbi:MAG: hypothetical protein MK212_05330 [Saprospiraceae bacterium]|nr:hypothetical protein [Saprospiraceae bacterium]
MQFRYLYCLLFSIISFYQCSACSFAYQYSYYPLGISGGSWIILEAELERYVNTPENMIMMGGMGRNTPMGGGMGNRVMEVRWKGNLRLKSLQNGELILLEELIYLDLNDDTYAEELQPHFEKALEKAQALPLFQTATLKQLGLCDYDKQCTFFQKEIDREASKVYCYLNKEGYKEHKQEITFPHKTLEKFENMTKQKFTDIESIELETRNDYYSIWLPYSACVYEADGQEMVVYTLSWGQKKGETFKQAATWDVPSLGSIDQFIKGREVLFHGHRFDTMHIIP